MDNDRVHFSKKYLTSVGVTYGGGVYTVRVFDGDRSLTLELTRAQAINLFDELSDLIDLDLKKGEKVVKLPPSKSKFKKMRRIYKDV